MERTAKARTTKQRVNPLLAVVLALLTCLGTATAVTRGPLVAAPAPAGAAAVQQAAVPLGQLSLRLHQLGVQGGQPSTVGTPTHLGAGGSAQTPDAVVAIAALLLLLLLLGTLARIVPPGRGARVGAGAARAPPVTAQA